MGVGVPEESVRCSQIGVDLDIKVIEEYVSSASWQVGPWHSH